MWKKFIHSSVIASLFYSNVVWAGNGGIGGEKIPEEKRNSISIHLKGPINESTPLQGGNSKRRGREPLPDPRDQSLINFSQLPFSINSSASPTPILASNLPGEKGDLQTSSLINATPLEKRTKEGSSSDSSDTTSFPKKLSDKSANSSPVSLSGSSPETPKGLAVSPSNKDVNDSDQLPETQGTQSRGGESDDDITLPVNFEAHALGGAQPHQGATIQPPSEKEGANEGTSLLQKGEDNDLSNGWELLGSESGDDLRFRSTPSDSEGVRFAGDIGVNPRKSRKAPQGDGGDPENPLGESLLEEEGGKPIPHLIPAEFKRPHISFEPPLQLIEQLDSPPTNLLDSESSVLIPIPQSKLSCFLDSFPPEDRAILARIAQQDLEGTNTCGQKFAIGVALGVSAVASVGMVPVFNGGLVYLRDAHDIDLIDFPGSREIVFTYVLLSTIFDTLPRNINLLQNAFSYLSEDGIRGLINQRVLPTGFFASFPSIYKPLALCLFELYAMNKTHNNGISQFSLAIMLFSGFLFLNDYIANFKKLWNAQDAYEQLIPPLLSDIDILRHCFQKKLKALSQYIFQAPQIFVDQLYETIVNAKTNIKQDIPDIEEDNLEVAHTFFILRYFLALTEDMQQKALSFFEVIKAQLHARSSLEIIKDGVGFPLCLATSLLIFQLITNTALEHVLSPLMSNLISWPVATIAATIQTVGQQLTTPNFFNYLSDIENHDCPELRAFQKAFSFLQSCIFNGTLAVISMEICDKWFPNIWYMGMFAPLILSRVSERTISFDDSYHKKFPLQVKQFTSYFKKDKNRSKRDFLLNLLQKEYHRVKILSPFILDKLNQSLQLSKGDDSPYI